MIKFLKKRKRVRIQNRINKLKVKEAKYQKQSETEHQNAESIKRLIDKYTDTENIHSLYTDTENIHSLNKWLSEYTNHAYRSAQYKTISENYKEQIDDLQKSLSNL